MWYYPPTYLRASFYLGLSHAVGDNDGVGLDRRLALDVAPALRTMGALEHMAEKRFSEALRDKDSSGSAAAQHRVLSSARRSSRRRGGMTQRLHYFDRLCPGGQSLGYGGAGDQIGKTIGARLAGMRLDCSESLFPVSMSASHILPESVFKDGTV